MRRIAALLLIILPGMAAAQDGVRLITATARAEVAADADMAVVTVGVENTSRTAAAALAANSADMSAVMELLRAAGLERRDIQTAGVAVDPLYSRDTANRQITGYAARNQVEARIRDLTRLGELLDRVVSNGANRLYGLRFDVQDRDPLADRALALAVERARAKAELMAEAAGVGLGALISISEAGGFAGPSPLARDMVMEATAVPIAGGQLAVSATVTLVYEIAP